MSHDHDLRCEACDATCSADYKRHKRSFGDSLVERAVEVGLLHKEVGHFWGSAWSDDVSEVADFVAQHARCNAFFEVGECGCACGPRDSEGEVTSIRRRILVKNAPEPACGTCLGRRVVPCGDCR